MIAGSPEQYHARKLRIPVFRRHQSTPANIVRPQRRRRSVAIRDPLLLWSRPRQRQPPIHCPEHDSLAWSSSSHELHHHPRRSRTQPQPQPPAAMQRTAGFTFSGLVAVLFLFLFAAPALCADWNEAYCSNQNTGNTDVCKYHATATLRTS